MSILVDSGTRLICQGITGANGSFHSHQMLQYGTRLVAGVTPGKGGTCFAERVPIFDTVAEAVKETRANSSIVFVPAQFAADAILEAAESGIGLIVTITEGIPVLDMVMVKEYLRTIGTRLVGPNCPGVITPSQCKVGIMPAAIHKPGRVGVVSRSGTLTYEAVAQLSALGIGQSTCIGIGGDPVTGMSFVDVLELFEHDPQTGAVVLIGEIGGNTEEQAAEYIHDHMTKPVVAFIAGQTAPREKRMGHAGAIISRGRGTAAGKIRALQAAGVAVAATPAEIGRTLTEVFKG